MKLLNILERRLKKCLYLKIEVKNEIFETFVICYFNLDVVWRKLVINVLMK